MTFRVEDTTTICIDTCFSAPFQFLAFHKYEAAPYVPRHNMPYCFSLLPDSYVLGDVNADGVVDLGDVLHLIAYLYKGGPAPSPLEAGDADCSGVIDLGDVLFIISYLYKGGPAPSC